MIWAGRGEFDLFCAVGDTLRQLRGVVTGEAALMSALSAMIGFIASLEIAVIIPTVYGGNSWGILNLDHTAAAADAIREALPIGIIGLMIAISIGALAGLLTSQAMLRLRRLIDELQAEGH